MFLAQPAAEFVPENSIDTPRQSRPIPFYIALVIYAFALMSPINYLATGFFFMRVAQHLLIISIFPMLFMRSNPLPVIFYGLPRRWRSALEAGWNGRPRLRYWVRQFTPKGVMWFVFVAAVWLWYDKTLLQLSLEHLWLRQLELVTLTLAALFHWWHITGAAPRIHKKLPTFAHVGYTLASAAPLKVPGLFLLFSFTAAYPAYATANFLGWEIDPLLSQQLGGMLVWVLGGVAYSTTALGLVSRWLELEENKPVQPRSIWETPEKMIAPGLEDYV